MFISIWVWLYELAQSWILLCFGLFVGVEHMWAVWLSSIYRYHDLLCACSLFWCCWVYICQLKCEMFFALWFYHTKTWVSLFFHIMYELWVCFQCVSSIVSRVLNIWDQFYLCLYVDRRSEGENVTRGHVCVISKWVCLEFSISEALSAQAS